MGKNVANSPIFASGVHALQHQQNPFGLGGIQGGLQLA